MKENTDSHATSPVMNERSLDAKVAAAFGYEKDARSENEEIKSNHFDVIINNNNIIANNAEISNEAGDNHLNVNTNFHKSHQFFDEVEKIKTPTISVVSHQSTLNDVTPSSPMSICNSTGTNHFPPVIDEKNLAAKVAAAFDHEIITESSDVQDEKQRNIKGHIANKITNDTPNGTYSGRDSITFEILNVDAPKKVFTHASFNKHKLRSKSCPLLEPKFRDSDDADVNNFLKDQVLSVLKDVPKPLAPQPIKQQQQMLPNHNTEGNIDDRKGHQLAVPAFTPNSHHRSSPKNGNNYTRALQPVHEDVMIAPHDIHQFGRQPYQMPHLHHPHQVPYYPQYDPSMMYNPHHQNMIDPSMIPGYNYVDNYNHPYNVSGGMYPEDFNDDASESLSYMGDDGSIFIMVPRNEKKSKRKKKKKGSVGGRRNKRPSGASTAASTAVSTVASAATDVVSIPTLVSISFNEKGSDDEGEQNIQLPLKHRKGSKKSTKDKRRHKGASGSPNSSSKSKSGRATEIDDHASLPTINTEIDDHASLPTINTEIVMNCGNTGCTEPASESKRINRNRSHNDNSGGRSNGYNTSPENLVAAWSLSSRRKPYPVESEHERKRENFFQQPMSHQPNTTSEQYSFHQRQSSPKHQHKSMYYSDMEGDYQQDPNNWGRSQRHNSRSTHSSVERGYMSNEYVPQHADNNGSYIRDNNSSRGRSMPAPVLRSDGMYANTSLSTQPRVSYSNSPSRHSQQPSINNMSHYRGGSVPPSNAQYHRSRVDNAPQEYQHTWDNYQSRTP